MNKKTLHIISIVSLIFIAAALVMIFVFSSENATKSSETSGRLTNIFINLFYKDFDTLSLSEQDVIRSNAEHIIRKLAHFTEFMILGFLLIIHVYTILEYKNKRSVFSLIYVPLFGVAYAVSDECHQILSDGRAPQIKDVLIDSSGVITGVLLSFLLLTLIKHIIIKKKSEGIMK